MVFIELNLTKGKKCLLNVQNITNIIDHNGVSPIDEITKTRIYSNDMDYIDVIETYEDIKEKLNDSCEYGLVIKMDQK